MVECTDTHSRKCCQVVNSASVNNRPKRFPGQKPHHICDFLISLILKVLIERFHFNPSSTGEAVELQQEQGVSEIPGVRKSKTDAAWLGPKESAVRQHRQEMKTKMKSNKVEDVKPTRAKQARQSRVCFLTVKVIRLHPA